MSSVSRRPRVKCVTSACIEGAMTGCVTAVSVLVKSAIRSLNQANREAGLRLMQTLPAKNTRTILPVSSIQAQLPAVTGGIRQQVTQDNLSSLERSKLATLL